MEVFYHGTCRLFDSFDPNRLGSGEGKSKFGHGIYITSSYETAALYASKVAKCHGCDCKYVYTLEVPDLTDNNHVFSCKPVNPIVAERLQTALGETIPEEAKSLGKFTRPASTVPGQRTMKGTRIPPSCVERFVPLSKPSRLKNVGSAPPSS